MCTGNSLTSPSTDGSRRGGEGEVSLSSKTVFSGPAQLHQVVSIRRVYYDSNGPSDTCYRRTYVVLSDVGFGTLLKARADACYGQGVPCLLFRAPHMSSSIHLPYKEVPNAHGLTAQREIVQLNTKRPTRLR